MNPHNWTEEPVHKAKGVCLFIRMFKLSSFLHKQPCILNLDHILLTILADSLTIINTAGRGLKSFLNLFHFKSFFFLLYVSYQKC